MGTGMTSYLFIIFVCNIIDVISTVYFTQTKNFIELNPFMGLLLERPLVVIVVKVALASIVLWRLWQCRQEKIAHIAAWIITTGYSAIAIYYILCFLKGGFL